MASEGEGGRLRDGRAGLGRCGGFTVWGFVCREWCEVFECLGIVIGGERSLRDFGGCGLEYNGMIGRIRAWVPGMMRE